LKIENFQPGGAYKFRCAYNAIAQLTPPERQRGVVAFSSGNHAQGVALAAKLLEVPAVICMPDDAPPVKLAATRGYGAEVVTYDRSATDREALARGLAQDRGMTLIPPYDHPHIMAGQGTAGLELIDAVPDLDAVIAPIGGGGLITGCATAVKGRRSRIRVFGVETVGADDVKRSIERGERVTIPPPDTIADGIRTQAPGILTFPIIQEYVEDVLIVSDEDVLDAVRLLLLRLKIVVEPTGAVPLAAVLRGLVPADCRRIGVILSGGNIDPSLLGALWA
jgi:threonine dehydratase